MSGNEPEHYTSKKLYFGNRMEADFTNLASGASQDWEIKNVRVYIDGPDGRTGSFEFHPNEPPADRAKPLVYHQDHLGSIDAVTEYGVTTATFALDDDGKPSRYSYDPWGERRDPLDWDGAPSASTSPGGVTPRGFTDHEMLDDLGLVHMNGRIYDGQIGRFLSADVHVQFPGRLQSFNRYSYVRNNPLTYTDPSGYAEARTDEEEERLQRLQEQRRNEVNRMVNGESAADRIRGAASNAATNGASVGTDAPNADVVAGESIDAEFDDTIPENILFKPLEEKGEVGSSDDVETAKSLYVKARNRRIDGDLAPSAILIRRTEESGKTVTIYVTSNVSILRSSSSTVPDPGSGDVRLLKNASNGVGMDSTITLRMNTFFLPNDQTLTRRDPEASLAHEFVHAYTLSIGKSPDRFSQAISPWRVEEVNASIIENFHRSAMGIQQRATYLFDQGYGKEQEVIEIPFTTEVETVPYVGE